MALRRRPDLAKARADLAHFAKLVGYPLAKWQTQSLKLRRRTTVLLASRQMGKTRSLAVLAVWWAFRQPDQEVLVISAGDDVARELLAEIRGIITRSDLLIGSVIDEQQHLVTFSNGSRVRSVASSEKRVRGRRIDLLLIDEAARVEDELIEGAAIPTTSARADARVVLASTPFGAAGSFYRYALAGDGRSEHVETHRWMPKAVGGKQDAPWITAETIAHMRAVFDSRRFAREYLLKFTAASDVLIDPETLGPRRVRLDLPSLDELRPGARLWIGCDWGVVRDASVCVGIARLPLAPWNPNRPPKPVFIAWTLRAWPSGTPNDRVVAEIVSSPGSFDLVSSELNSLGYEPSRALFDRLAARVGDQRLLVGATPGIRTNGVVTGSANKERSYSTVVGLLERDQLLIGETGEGEGGLADELVGLRYELGERGSFVRIEAAGIGHDDQADGLAICTGPHSANGRDLNALGMLAAQRELPEARLPASAADAETITTPTGLTLPKTPWLQSVSGEEVTAPAGQTRGDGVNPILQRAREQIAARHATERT